MTVQRIAFWFGLLELGFVLGVAFAFPLLIVAVAGPACLALMLPEIRQAIGRAGRRQALRRVPVAFDSGEVVRLVPEERKA